MKCVLKAVEAIKDDLVEFTRTLVKIPSFTGQEEEVAKVVLAKLQEFGIDQSWIDEIGNVVGVLRGKSQGPNILLNGHLDVVPAGKLDNWRYDPFGAEIDADGNIRGRGTADMKGGLAALIFTMKIMKDLRDQGVEFPGDVIFSAVVFEEAAEMFGMDYLCKISLPKKELSFDICYLAEPTTGNINLGHRGKVEIVLKTQGRTAHSSQPLRGINALEKMLPVLDQIFNKMSRDLPGHPDLGQSSITVTNLVCRPGTLSIIPDECEASVDRRYIPGESPGSIVVEFEALFEEIKRRDPQFKANAGVRTFLEKSYTGYRKEVQKHHPVWIIEKDHPFVKKTQQALKRVGQKGNLGYFIGGVDGGMTAGLMGIPTIGYSGADENLAHTPDEHIPIKTLVEDTKAYAAILYQLFSLDKKHNSH
jgi:putative selenium metabolism hydrolase